MNLQLLYNGLQKKKKNYFTILTCYDVAHSDCSTFSFRRSFGPNDLPSSEIRNSEIAFGPNDEAFRGAAYWYSVV